MLTDAHPPGGCFRLPPGMPSKADTTAVEDRLTGQAAIVSGGASGIGCATCMRLAAERASVMVADLDETGARETAGLIGESAISCRALYLLSDESTFVTGAEFVIDGGYTAV